MSNERAALIAAQQHHLVDQVMANDRIAREFGLSLTELQLLHLLLLRPEVQTAGQLVEVTGLSTSTVSDMVDRLHRLGFVDRVRSTTDRRKVRLTPTERCGEIGLRYRDVELTRRLDRALEGFTPAEVRTIVEYFERLNSA